MNCPRCKGENPEQSKVCGHCGLKIKTVCPRCKALNKLGQQRCVKCDLMLIRYCPQCNAANFPNSKNCRKCNKVLIKPKRNVKKVEKDSNNIDVSPNKDVYKPATQSTAAKVDTQQINVNRTNASKEASPDSQVMPETVSKSRLQQEVQVEKQAHEPQKEVKSESKSDNKKVLSSSECVGFFSNLIQNSDSGGIVNLLAQNGAGKSTIIANLTQTLKEDQLIWLVGNSYPNTVAEPYSFIKDMIKTLFGIPAFVSDIEEAKKGLKKTIESNLGISDANLFNVLNKILFYSFENSSEDIFANKDSVKNSLLNLVTKLSQNSGIVMVLEDYEYIDKASIECLNFIINSGFLEKKNFVLITGVPEVEQVINKNFMAQAAVNKLITIELSPMQMAEMDAVAASMLHADNILPEIVKVNIYKSPGISAFYVEQALWYLFQAGAIYSENDSLKFKTDLVNIQIPQGVSEILFERFNYICSSAPAAIRVLQAAALCGVRFSPSIVQAITGLSDEDMNQVLQLLVGNGIFIALDQFSFKFKHSLIWKTIYEKSFSDEDFVELNKKLLELYEGMPGLYYFYCAKPAEVAGDYIKALNYYNQAGQQALYLGADVFYTQSQMKVLELLPKSGIEQEEQETYVITIEEKLGKVNYEINPQLAIDKLTKTIEKYEKVSNSVKVIELTGYLSKSCELVGNYVGVLECVDKALELIEDKSANTLKHVLMLFSKLDATFHLGRLEEVINTANNEIIPVLNKAVSKNESFTGLSSEDISSLLYETELILAKAYVFQGNIKALELCDSIAAKAVKEEKPSFELQALLYKALFVAIQGDIKQSNAILSSLSEKSSEVKKSKKIKLYWFLIAVLSNFVSGNLDQARNICYSCISLANECKDFTVFTLVKLLIGRCYQHFQYYKNALSIYDETVSYCAENKYATGALFSWYFAAEAELHMGNPGKAKDIAERALDIAHKSNINNILASIMLSRLIAEVRIIDNDFEGAQINTESAIELAEKNQLKWALIQLYMTYGKIYQENASFNEQNKAQSANSSYKLYNKALEITESLDNQFLTEKVEKEISSITAFCNMSGIELEEV